MSFDHLAVGAGACESAACLVDLAEQAVVGGLGPQLLAERALELRAAAGDEPVRGDEARRRDRGGEQCFAFGDRPGERFACRPRARACRVEPGRGLLRVSHRDREIFATRVLVAGACSAYGS